MKKFIALLLAVTLIFLLAACDNSADNTSTPNNTSVPTQTETQSSSEVETSTVVETSSEIISSDETPSTTSSEENVSSEPTESSEPIESSEPAHTHVFSDATCTEPKKCSCGATDGDALGHNFSEGVCTVCGEADPDFKYQPITDGTWVASANNGNLMFILDFDPELSSFTYQSGGIDGGIGDGDSFTYVEDGNTIIITDSCDDTITLERTANTILKLIATTGSYYGVGELMQPGVEFIYTED